LPAEIEDLRQAYEKRLKEVQADGAEFAGWGRGGGIMEWPDDQTTPLRSGSWTFEHVDGDTLVVETRRYQDGHELAIVERIRIQDGRMNYKHEVTGPRGKHDERDIVFDLS
jgi:hypothetical protein